MLQKTWHTFFVQKAPVGQMTATRKWLAISLGVLLLLQYGLCAGEVVRQLPGNEKIIALTFDACETKTPSFVD